MSLEPVVDTGLSLHSLSIVTLISFLFPDADVPIGRIRHRFLLHTAESGEPCFYSFKPS